jgi:hypothetical protein
MKMRIILIPLQLLFQMPAQYPQQILIRMIYLLADWFLTLKVTLD